MKITQQERTKFFIHDFLERKESTRDDSSEGRFYHFEKKRYPSITTVLSRTSDKKWLNEWKKNVGEDQANTIVRRAARRGSSLHLICEHYLLNYERYDLGSNPVTTYLFNQIKEYIDNNITSVYGIELPLFSNSLNVAGTCDILCTLNGVNTIVDFKTSAKPKDKEWIEDYFLQATAYSIMAEEMYGKEFNQVCIIITTETGEPQFFIEQPLNYKDILAKRIEQFSS
jgi:genome maintenance exonuclease 1